MNVTTIADAEIDADSATDLEPATNVYIGVSLTDANAVEAAHLASLMAKVTVTVNAGQTLAVTTYTTQNLADLEKANTSTSIINVTMTGTTIDGDTDTDLADANNIYLASSPTVAATDLAALLNLSPGRIVTVNAGKTLTVTDYTTEDLRALVKADGTSTIAVTTKTDATADIDATHLADADTIGISGTATGTAADALTLGPSKISVTGTYNISAYTTEALGPLTKSGGGAINVTTIDNAELKCYRFGRC